MPVVSESFFCCVSKRCLNAHESVMLNFCSYILLIFGAELNSQRGLYPLHLTGRNLDYPMQSCSLPLWIFLYGHDLLHICF